MSNTFVKQKALKLLAIFVGILLYFSLCHTVKYQVFMDEFFEYGSGMKLFKNRHLSYSFFNHGIINPTIVEICAHVLGKEMSFSAARFCQIMMGALSSVATFYLASMFFPLKVAVVSSFFFTISPYFNISSHRILSDNPALLAFLLTLIFLEKYSEKSNGKFLIYSGFFYGISIASKFYMIVYM